MKPAIPAVLLLAIAASMPAESRGHAIFKSTDRARTWLRAGNGLPGNARINAFGSTGGALFAGTDIGIFVSRDQARSWHPLTGAASASGRILSIATLGEAVHAGTARNGLLTSRDGGGTWFRNSSLPARKVLSLLVDRGVFYAGTDAGGVWTSIDGGQTWTAISNGLPLNSQVFAMSALNGRVFAALYAKGLYAWNSPLRRWVNAGRVTPLVIAPSGRTLLVGHNPGGIFRSDDEGATWSQSAAAELSNNAPVWEMKSGEGLVLAGAADGIFYSEDRGRTWVRARGGLPPESPGVSFLISGEVILAGVIVKD